MTTRPVVVLPRPGSTVSSCSGLMKKTMTSSVSLLSTAEPSTRQKNSRHSSTFTTKFTVFQKFFASDELEACLPDSDLNTSHSYLNKGRERWSWRGGRSYKLSI